MKICLQSDQFSVTKSGIGIHTNNLVNGLVDRGHEVVLICSEKTTPKRPDFEYEYVPSWSWDPNHAKWFSFAINTRKRINDIHKRHRFDIFHSLDAREGSLAAKKLSVPTIGSMNDYYFATATLNPMPFFREYKSDWFRRYLNYNFVRFYENHTLKNLDMIVANSTETMRIVSESYKIPEHKICRLFKAISHFPQRKNEIKERKRGDYKILMVGVGLQRKGIFYLIRAASLVKRSFPNARFVIVGHAQKKIIQECHRLGVEKMFDFRGVLKRGDINPLFERADAFVLPSLIEGFGVSVVEAMSYGIPSIGSRVGGLPDIIKDEKNGLLVSPKDSRGLAESMIRLLSDVKLRKRLSKEAFRSAKRFNTESQLENTIKIYKRCLEL